jgi:hypothetical protein
MVANRRLRIRDGARRRLGAVSGEIRDGGRRESAITRRIRLSSGPKPVIVV